MNRADPFDEFDGCGDGTIDVAAAGRLDKNYNLWSRNPIEVSAAYLDSDGMLSKAPRESDINCWEPVMSGVQNRILLVIAVSSLAVSSPRVGASDGSAPARGSTALDVAVSLWDGETVLSVPGLKAGEVLPPERAKDVAPQMLQSWRRSQGEARWAAWARNVPGSGSRGTSAGRSTHEVHRARSAALATRREEVDRRGLQELPQCEGCRRHHRHLVHMRHPDGSNTHPETYPKFQSQTKKEALLRDIINWCIENPLKGKPLAENDPVLRSVEGYILSTRKGTPLEAGKHRPLGLSRPVAGRVWLLIRPAGR